MHSIAKNMMTQYLFCSSDLTAASGFTSSPVFFCPAFSIPSETTRSFVEKTVMSTRTTISATTQKIAPV